MIKKRMLLIAGSFFRARKDSAAAQKTLADTA